MSRWFKCDGYRTELCILQILSPISNTYMCRRKYKNVDVANIAELHAKLLLSLAECPIYRHIRVTYCGSGIRSIRTFLNYESINHILYIYEFNFILCGICHPVIHVLWCWKYVPFLKIWASRNILQILDLSEFWFPSAV